MICASGEEVVRIGAIGRLGLAGALLTLVSGSCALVAPLDEIASKTSIAPDSGDGPPENDGGGDAGAGGGGSGGSGGSSSDAGGPCTTHAECSRRDADQPYRCIRNACVPLRTNECPAVYSGKTGTDEGEDFADDNAIVLGAYADIEMDPLKSQAVLNYRLALNELSGSGQGGLPLPNGDKRPLVLVVCDTTPEPAGYQGIAKSMTHLVGKLGVPAVLASLDTADLLRAFDDFARPNGVFFLSPLNSNEQLAGQNDNSLLWHMLGMPTDMVPAYKSLLEKLEKLILASKPAGEKLKVALVWTDDAFNNELVQTAVLQLTFNGKGVSANETDGFYKSVKLEPSSDIPNEVAALRAFKPHVLISMANGSFIDSGMLDLFEREYGYTNKVHYVLSPFNRADTPIVKALITEFITREIESPTGVPTAHKRYMGVNVAGAEDQTLYNEYYTRLTTSFEGVQPGRENFYDALYFLAYGIHAAGSTTVLSGRGIAQAMPSLINGAREFSVGPMDRLTALAFLSGTQPMRLIGTLGPPDFNLETGSRVDTGGVYCFSWDQSSAGGAVVATDFGDVMRFDNVKKQLRFSELYAARGSAPCLEQLRDP
jgi:hypothetical protein